MRRTVKFFLLIFPVLVSSLVAADWYVRPAGGNYGAENGTSYANAWDGLKNVVWGTGGVIAGDTLYICGLHVMIYDPYYANRIITPIGGSSESTRVTIRGDYAGEPGVMWSGCLLKHESWVNEGNNTYSITLPEGMGVQWFFQDVTVSSWIVLTKVNSVASCKENPGSHYSSDYSQDSKLYVHCSDNGDPTDRIVINYGGWFWACDDASYLTFKNIGLYCPNIVSAFSHMRYDGCTIWYGDVNLRHFDERYSYPEVINCDLGYSYCGLAFSQTVSGAAGPNHALVRGNKIHDMGTVPALYNTDAHAIGVNALFDSIIELNEMYNCGSTLTFYAYDSGRNSSIKNNIVRWNYIHDNHQLGGAPGNGIEFACGASHGDCSGNQCYGNIVINVKGDAYRTKWKQTVRFYNNVAYGAGGFSYYFGNYVGEVRVEAKNNISMNPGAYHIEFQTNASPGNYVCDVDYNLYYPDTGTKFIFQDATGAQYLNFNGWKSLSKSGCTFDPHSLIGDPLFVNGSGNYSLDTDFQIPSNSPAKDAGTDVGLTEDYFGNAIPQGDAPDIGIHEYVVEGNPIHTIKLAPGTKVKIGAGAKIRIKN